MGHDIYTGPYQNETGSDGVGDTPYIIDVNNEDRYPLMKPWTPLLGDINDDGKVDLKDVYMAASAYGSYSGSAKWVPEADINNDGKVDLKDLYVTWANYGKTHL